jgi:hypothetical protein
LYHSKLPTECQCRDNNFTAGNSVLSTAIDIVETKLGESYATEFRKAPCADGSAERRI